MCTFLLKSIFILFILGISKADECSQNALEMSASLRLQNDLFCDYDKTVRPVINSNNAVNIQLQFLLNRYDLFPIVSEISAEGWLLAKWTDAHLKWDPEDYENVKRLYLISDNLWIPDLTIFNPTTYGSLKVFEKTAECLLSFDSELACVTFVELQGSCILDLRYWPFDTQTCYIKMGSWFHKGHEINLTSTFNMHHGNDIQDHPEYEIISYKVFDDPGKFECCPNDTFPSVKFEFVIKKYSGVSVVTIILPYFVLVTITLLTLWLNPTASDRIYLSALNISCHIVYLQECCWLTPDAGAMVPYLILFLRNSLLMTTLILIETLYVRKLLEKNTEFPRWLVTSFKVIVTSKPGQLFLFSELNPEEAVTNLTADDNTNLMEINQTRLNEWYLLGKIIDRILFISYIIAYFIMALWCIPK